MSDIIIRKDLTAKILGDAAAEMSEVVRFSKKHNADPFGTLLSVVSRAIEKAYEEGWTEGRMPDAKA